MADVSYTKPRSMVIDLDYPLTVDGKLYERITVRRLTGAEVSAFFKSVEADPNVRLPMFDVPFAVIDALDADDSERVMEAMASFLPRALRPEAGPPPASGAATS